MQVKQQALAQHLQKKIAPLYVLIGQEHYLIEESLKTLLSTIRKQHNVEEKILSIQGTDDWDTLIEEANSYSLFSDTVLLNVFYEKKTIDAAGKKILTEYLKSVNSRCCIIIRAPNVPSKQLQWLVPQEQAVVVVSYSLNDSAMKQWIASQLKLNSLHFGQQVPGLIHQYTQGNMLACAQVIEKIALSNEPNSEISSQKALEHLSDQCEHTLYELVDACLQGHADKAIHILRQSAENKSEPTLILWLLTQEVRTLLQLTNAVRLKTDFKAACNQLKIWPQRIPLYQLSIKRLSHPLLLQLHHQCALIDEQIKSNLNTQVWNALEHLSISLCLGNTRRQHA